MEFITMSQEFQFYDGAATSVLSKDLHFKLNKAKFVFLVMLHPPIVGPALHMDQLPRSLRINLD